MKLKIDVKILQAAVIGVCIIISAWIFGAFFYGAKNAGNTMKVTGWAVKRVNSDMAKWTLTFARKNFTSDGLQAGYGQIKLDIEHAMSILKANGITEQETNVQPAYVDQQYGGEGQTIDKYTIRQEITVTTTNNIAKLEALSMSPNTLLEKGMILQNTYLQYLISDLTLVKRDLISEATKDAIQRGQEISKKTGIRLGKLIEARIGVFQINAPNSNDVSGYGTFNTTTKEKDVSVPVTLSFVLE